MENEYQKDKVIGNMQLLRDPVATRILEGLPVEPLPVPEPGGSRLDQIAERGFLRVGYLTDSLPYAYFNAAGDLVGFDVEMAHRLALELGVSLEFVPIDRPQAVQQLNAGYCDVLMSGFVVTTPRAQDMVFSAPYLDETMAFLVKDHRRDEFASWEDINKMEALKLGVPNLPYMLLFAQQVVPGAELKPFQTAEDVFGPAGEDLDAVLLGAERSSAWSLLYPEYSVTVPQPNPMSYPLAYPVAGSDERLARFLSTWIELKRRDGTIQSLYDYWILGKNAEPKQPRWSIIRNVLHWIP